MKPCTGLRKRSTFGDAITGFPAKWRLRNERRNSILMTCHHTDLSCASDWLKQISLAARPIGRTTQMWVVTCHQYGISSLAPLTSFRGKTKGSQTSPALTLKTLFSSSNLIKLATTVPLPEAWWISLSRLDDLRISMDGEMVCCRRRVAMLYDPVWKNSVRTLFSFDAQTRLLKGMPISCRKNSPEFIRFLTYWPWLHAYYAFGILRKLHW